MTDLNSSLHLYQTFTQLAWLEARLGKMPVDPFLSTDRDNLVKQSDLAGSCATRLRQCSASDMGDLTEAQKYVDKAVAELTAIVNFVPNSLTPAVVLSDVQTAIIQVNSVLPAGLRLELLALG